MNRGSSVSRRTMLQAASALGATSIFPRGASADDDAPEQPDILFVCTDQQHWQACGYMDSFYDTPSIDRFAAGGVAFDHAFCTTPQCSPSRSSMLSGFFPSTTGVMNNVNASGGGPLKLPTIGKMLQDAGYQTAIFGKWHLGNEPVGNEGWTERETKNNDHRATQNAVKFLRKVRDDRANGGQRKPFALFVMYLNPHDIYHFRPDDADTSPPSIRLSKSWHGENFRLKPSVQKKFMTHNQGTLIEGSEQRVWERYRDYYRQKIRMVDHEFGQVFSALEQYGFADSTCSFFTSDHGDMDTHHRLIFKGPFMYEHMVRVPFVARLPKSMGGRQGVRVPDYDVVLTDVVPTLRDLAGLDQQPSHGHSLRNAIAGTAPAGSARQFVVSEYYGKQKWVNPIRMLRTHDFKYNRYIEHGEELYDLKNDPDELVNLADDSGYISRKLELQTALRDWMNVINDPFDSFTSNDRTHDDHTGRRRRRV